MLTDSVRNHVVTVGVASLCSTVSGALAEKTQSWRRFDTERDSSAGGQCHGRPPLGRAGGWCWPSAGTLAGAAGWNSWKCMAPLAHWGFLALWWLGPGTSPKRHAWPGSQQSIASLRCHSGRARTRSEIGQGRYSGWP